MCSPQKARPVIYILRVGLSHFITKQRPETIRTLSGAQTESVPGWVTLIWPVTNEPAQLTVIPVGVADNSNCFYRECKLLLGAVIN